MRTYIITIIIFFSAISLHGASVSDSLLNVGKVLFKSNCKACHNVDKKLVGPALSKVYERRDSTWIYDFVKGSQKMIADGDPIAVGLYSEFNEVIMPDQKVDDNEIGLILSYIKDFDQQAKSPSSNPISRPDALPMVYSDHFRFSNYLFWIPFTISVILIIAFLHFMTYFEEIVDEQQRRNMEQ